MSDGGLTVVVTVPGLKVVSEANVRTHWSVRNKRKRDQQTAVAVALAAVGAAQRDRLRAAKRVELTLVRLGGRKLDRDNLAGSFKGCLDQVAKWLQVDDGDEERLGLSWRQEPGGDYGVRIELHAGEG